MRYHYSAMLAYYPLLLKGALLTLELIAIGGVCGIALGIFGAWARSDGPRPLKMAVGAYVEIVRNTPFLVQLFFIFSFCPSAGMAHRTAASLAMQGAQSRRL